MEEFIANHNNFVKSRDALSDLIKDIRSKLDPGSNNTNVVNNTGSRTGMSVRNPPSIDPSNYVPRVQRFGRVQKRQIFGFLASLLASVGLSSAFGAVNGAKIDHLADALEQTVSRQDLLLSQVEENSQNILTNRHLLSNIHDVVKIVSDTVRSDHWKLHGVYLFLLIQTELEKLDSLMDTFVSVISSACNGKLHIGALSEPGAREVFQRIHNVAKNSGLTPVINTPSQISELPLSWTLTEKGIKLILHCIVTSESKTFRLYKYNPFIITMGRSQANEGPAVFGKIQPRNSILAIASDNRFVELTPYELSLCSKLGEIFVCNQNIFNKPSKVTCLSSLYKADHRNSIELCALSLETANSDQVLETSPNTFMYFSKQGSNSYHTICKGSNDIRKISQLTQFSNLEIPVSCHLDTPEYYIYRRDSLSTIVDPQPQLYQWTLPPLDFFKDDVEIKDLETAVKKLESFQGVPEITSATIQKLHHMQRPLVKNYPLLSTMAMAGISLAAVIIIILAICIQAHKHRKALMRANNPSYRYQELLKDESKVDALLQLVQDRQAQNSNG